MEVYILSRKDLSTLSISKPIDYSINLDEETNAVTTITLPSLAGAEKGNFVMLDGLYRRFLFVIDEVTSEKDYNSVTLSCLDISNIFDRKIIEHDTDKMLTDGIENFIADMILENFINSTDSVLNIGYIDVYVNSNTLANVATDSQNSLYNLHTFMTNCRQYKNINTKFTLVQDDSRKLRIDITNETSATYLVDTTLAEVTNYEKVYEVDPVAKVQAYIRETNETYNLYLKSDRTTTTDKDDPDRISGRIEVLSCDTYDNAVEEALNTIKANTYTHLVQFSLPKTSKLIDVTKLEIGTLIKIKTDESIYDSYISAITLTDENFVSFKSGNLRIDFTDKQRQQQLSGTIGNKVDTTGGTITGSVKVEGTLSTSVGDVMGEKVLYENSTGNTGTITLSESVANFKYIEIFYLSLSDGACGYSQSSTKIWQPNGKSAWLSTGCCVSSNHNVKIVAALLSGASITRPYSYWEFADNTSSQTNYIGITKVIGYR